MLPPSCSSANYRVEVEARRDATKEKRSGYPSDTVESCAASSHTGVGGEEVINNISLICLMLAFN